MPLPQEFRKTGFTHRRGLAADKPDASDVLVGTLYFSTDTGDLERSDGTVWETYSVPGSGSINNNFIVPPVFDGIDADESLTIPPGLFLNRGTNIFTITSTGDLLDINFGNCDIIVMNNASSTNIHSLRRGFPGQIVVIYSINAVVGLRHQSGTSGINEAKLFNFATTTAADTPIHLGCAAYMYYDADNTWRMIYHTQGIPITPTFSAGDFTGNASMTWTVDSGDVLVDQYEIRGKRVIYDFYYNQTTVGGTPNTDLRRAIPSILTPRVAGNIMSQWSRNLDNGTANDGFAYIFGTGGLFMFFRRDKTSGNWAASTNNTAVQGTIQWDIA